MKNIISTSIFDLFKIGPGPSSSHTIGPMKAGNRFRAAIAELPKETLASARNVLITLYGSLALTGKGHGTDRSVAGGLLGMEPETCDTDKLLALLTDASETHPLDIAGCDVRIGAANVIFDRAPMNFPYQNTVVFSLQSDRKALLEKEYYSIGGGFILEKGREEPAPRPPKYPYRDMASLKDILVPRNLPLWRLMLDNEMAITGCSEKKVEAGLDKILEVMDECVERGLATVGRLPGAIGLDRKAQVLYNRESNMTRLPDRFLLCLNAYAMAVSEENAAGRRAVTAPTSGSAGVIPAVLRIMSHHFHKSKVALRKGLLSAAAIGFIAKHNASISGAEVGCQGEIGVASAMAAALIAAIDERPIEIIENAAEIALEHHLGLTCDPVGGYVQIPCIERNAVGAVTAYNAYLLAAAGDPRKQKINLDQTIEAMLETGRDMCRKYKETAEGGLAVCSVKC